MPSISMKIKLKRSRTTLFTSEGVPVQILQKDMRRITNMMLKGKFTDFSVHVEKGVVQMTFTYPGGNTATTVLKEALIGA